MTEIKDFVLELCDTPSPHGREFMCREVLDKYFNKYCDGVEESGNESVIYHSKGENNGARIMLDAHIDEIALIISEILSNGFLKFTTVGAINAPCLLAKPVIVYGKENIKGTIGVIPKFAEEKGKENVVAEELFIDTGLSCEDVKKMVPVGSLVLIERKPFMLTSDLITGRALDDKAGVAVMLETARELKKLKHRSEVYYSCSTREEGSGAGAASSAYQINPDIAIVIDVCGGIIPGKDMYTPVIMGNGPAVPIGNRADINLFNKVKETANEYSFPIQIVAMPGGCGNDAEIIQITRGGIPCVLLSIPLFYMHTAVEVVSMRDIKNTGKLIAAFISKIDEISLEELLCF